MIDLRVATIADADDLFAWRNDAATLACSKSTAPVSRPDHDRWMKYNVTLGYPEHIVLMADTEAGPVGVIRFDADKNDTLTYTASITVAPKHRCKGLSYPMLDLACGYMQEYAILADIRVDNTASRKTFERCGFREVSAGDGFIKYRKGPSA